MFFLSDVSRDAINLGKLLPLHESYFPERPVSDKEQKLSIILKEMGLRVYEGADHLDSGNLSSKTASQIGTGLYDTVRIGLLCSI